MESSYLPIYILTGIAMIAWLLPPFKQYKGKYFIFFLILAIQDPLALSLLYTLKIATTQTYSIMYMVVFLSLLEKEMIKRYWYLFTIILLFILISNFYLNYKEIVIFIIVSNLLILFTFLKTTAITYTSSYTIKTGYVVFILYQISALLKFYLVVGKAPYGIAFFYLTDAFEILVAIFFTIYKVEESPAIKLNFFTANK